MKWIHRNAPWLTLCLALSAGLQVWALWRQSFEHTSAQVTLEVQNRDLKELQAELTRLKNKASPVEVKPEATQLKNAAVQTPNQDPKVTEAAKEAAQLSAVRAKQLIRRSALQSYRAGLDALHLPQQTIEQVKQIILTNSDARTAANRKARTTEDRMANATKWENEEAAQLSTLIGAQAYEDLKASKLISGLDWTIGTDLWDGGAPLSQEQLKAIALAQVRTQSKKTHWSAEPLSSQIPDAQTQLSPQDTSLLAAVTNALSPKQQELLRRSLIEENQYNAAMRGFNKQQQQIWKAQKSGAN